VIGDSCTDIYNYGICDRLSPEAPVPILKTLYVEEKPGMVLNVDKNLKAFGHETLVLTNQEKIIKERFVDQRTMQHLLRVDKGEDNKVSTIDLFLLKTVQNMNFNFDCVVISDYNKGFLSYESSVDLIKILLKSKKPIFVDSKKKDLSCFRKCFIKINEAEYKVLEELPRSSELIVTLGSSGARWKNKLFPTVSEDVFDVCGAGDTFLSALVTAYMSTGSMEKAINFANKCAGISVKKFGNYVVSLGDLE